MNLIQVNVNILIKTILKVDTQTVVVKGIVTYFPASFLLLVGPELLMVSMDSLSLNLLCVSALDSLPETMEPYCHLHDPLKLDFF
jgi:hypothetical protein